MPICPLMSYAANQVPCVKDQCAIWDAREEACGYLSGPRRIESAVDMLVRSVDDIKVKI